METLFIEDYVNKITFLERRIGANVGYSPMAPIWNPRSRLKDPIELQEAAKRIAEFVGLGNLTFLVTVAKQKRNAAGHIELSLSGNEVFIEISDDLIDLDNTVLAILSHEITHKFMQLSSISCVKEIAQEYEEEILTDITAVFLGLGKLMLNGCEGGRTYQEVRAGGVCDTTQSHKCGYLSKQKLAFVYRLICAMRGLSEEDMVSGLTQNAIAAVRSCDCYYDDYFAPEFGSDSFISELISGLDLAIEEASHQMDKANVEIGLLKEFLRRMEQRVCHNRDSITHLQGELRSWENAEVYDPCLRFLDAARLKAKVSEFRATVSLSISDLTQAQRHLRCLAEKAREERYVKPPHRPLIKRLFARIAHL